jgi:hypothetical protein
MLRLPLAEPLCEFCRRKVLDANGNPTGETVFDYDELHAIECGVGDALALAPFWRSWQEHRKDWHYYILARGFTTAFMVVAVICAWRWF